MYIDLDIRQEHIDKGICADPKHCAAAIAILDADPAIANVTVGYFDILIVREGFEYESEPLPDWFRKWLGWFDHMAASGCDPVRLRLRFDPTSCEGEFSPRWLEEGY